VKHIVRFERGYDCRRFECICGHESCKPGSGGSHGRHGLSIRFVCQGDDGAVQFLLAAGWMPQHAKPDSIGVRSVDKWGSDAYPFDLGYHSKNPQYKGQEPIEHACEFCDGLPCHYDGSGLNANDAMYALVNGGDAGLWKFLEEYYQTVFHGAPYPVPCEFVKPPRALQEGGAM